MTHWFLPGTRREREAVWRLFQVARIASSLARKTAAMAITLGYPPEYEQERADAAAFLKRHPWVTDPKWGSPR